MEVEVVPISSLYCSISSIEVVVLAVVLVLIVSLVVVLVPVGS